MPTAATAPPSIRPQVTNIARLLARGELNDAEAKMIHAGLAAWRAARKAPSTKRPAPPAPGHADDETRRRAPRGVAPAGVAMSAEHLSFNAEKNRLRGRVQAARLRAETSAQEQQRRRQDESQHAAGLALSKVGLGIEHLDVATAAAQTFYSLSDSAFGQPAGDLVSFIANKLERCAR